MFSKTGQHRVEHFPALSSLDPKAAEAILRRAYKRTHGESWYRSSIALYFLASFVAMILLIAVVRPFAIPYIGVWADAGASIVAVAWVASIFVIEKRTVSRHIDDLLEESPRTLSK